MHALAFALAFSIVIPSALPREITFPPIAAIQSNQILLGDYEKIDIITGSQFSGLTTFAHISYVNCFLDSEAESRPMILPFLEPRLTQ